MKLNRGDSTDTVKQFILSDPFLLQSYSRIFTFINLDISKHNEQNERPLRILEIGGAGGISEMVFPNIIKTDVVYSKDLDLVCSGSNLPFKNQSIDIIIMKDSFHHLPDIDLYLSNAMKIIKVGSRIYIADPNWNFVSQFIYKYFHPEPFDKKTKKWVTDPTQPWHSNQALLWIVFKRDRKLFLKKFPNLNINEIGFSSGLSYIISGGVYSRNKIGSRFLLLLLKIENFFPIFSRFTSISKIIKVTKLW